MTPKKTAAAAQPGSCRRRPVMCVLTAPELAAELRLPVPLITAMLEHRGETFFTGAWREPAAEGQEACWYIPERAVTLYLRRRMDPLFTLKEAAEYLRLHPSTVRNGAEAWRRGDKNGFETVELLLPDGGVPRVHREARITLTELLRHLQKTPGGGSGG